MSRKFIPKRKSGNESGITLFPFLAVLLCTMGALIMLLVVIARNVREQSGVVLAAQPEAIVTVQPENAEPPAAEPIEEGRMTQTEAEELRDFIRLECEEADWFAENYGLSKEEKEESLNEARERLTALEKQNLKIKEDLERLAKLAEQMDAAEKPADLAELKKLLTAKQNEAEKIDAELKLLQAEIAQGKKSYAIIPYRGTNGTFRRPIYLECFEDRVVIQPEGVVLTRDDFVLENRAENPLDVALRVIRQYYMENNQIVRGTEPYPLMIVRPSGVTMYGNVRHSFGNWLQDFGYELVDEDWVMEYPEPSDELRERLEKQLQISRNRIQGYLEAMKTRQSDRGGATAFRFNNRGVAQPVGGGRGNGGGGRGYGDDPAPAGSPAYGAGGQSAQGTAPITRPGAARGGASVPAGNVPGEIPAQPGPGAFAGSNPPFAPGLARTNPLGPDLPTAGGPENAGGWQPAPSAPPVASAWPPVGSTAGEPAPFGPAHASQQPSTQQVPAGSPGQNAAQGGWQQAGEGGQNGQGCAPSPLQNMLPQAENRQQNWALRNVQPFSAGVTRKIKIQCEETRFVLTPQAGLTGMRVIPITDSVFQATDRLVLAVWDFMESWEMASDKMYWKPVLQVTVKPGGESRFQQLKQLLHGSGLEIEEAR